MQKCIFCGIEDEKKPEEKPYEDDRMVAFENIAPAAPVHTLIIPKKHIRSVTELIKEDTELLGAMIYQLKRIAEKKGIAEKGYKIVINNGKEGGQVIDHLHIHLLGGKQFEE